MNNRGFSLVELLSAIVIFVIISSVIAISSLRARQKAQNTAVAGAARKFAVEEVAPYVSDFPGKFRWGGKKKDKFLNGKIFKALSRPGRGNRYNYKNPASGSERIRVGGNAGKNTAAVLITNRRKYRYEVVSKRKKLLEKSRGLIVLWMSRRDPTVEVYYVDLNGRVSDFLWTP